MAISTTSGGVASNVVTTPENAAQAVSWAAIFAGSVATTALSLILIVLGSGLGLTIVSPWTAVGVSATTFAVSGAIWFVVVQWVSSGVGGYLAGRLRAKWIGMQGDETFFRDTAHGFVTWSFSTLIVTGLLGSAAIATVAGGASAVSSVASGAVQGVSQSAQGQRFERETTNYFVDSFFRAFEGTATVGAGSVSQPGGDARESKAEAARILMHSAASGSVNDADKTQLVRLVAHNTGMSPSDAQARVDQVLGQVEAAKVKGKETADKARKAGATFSLLAALSLVIGAFISSVAAAFGGKLRDEF